MTQDPSLVTKAATTTHPVLRAVLIAVVAAAVILALTAYFGVVGAGPSLEFAPDPAGALPF